MSSVPDELKDGPSRETQMQCTAHGPTPGSYPHTYLRRLHTLLLYGSEENRTFKMQLSCNRFLQPTPLLCGLSFDPTNPQSHRRYALDMPSQPLPRPLGYQFAAPAHGSAHV